ncbi:MAG: toll/interleukin-1 receptor domain-containing protein [Solobacterium sp.]|nr:toll/interleukin-1 receptor domain-containing protein [Solobacterium sp.]
MNNNESFFNSVGGGSVFISHSHHDLPKVRKIRNFLEENGFDPLCFFMQCLSDEDEIEDLLKREIDAREWFAFMESENSLQSAWVRKERDYIVQKSDKKVLFYKLRNESSPEDIARSIMDHMTVYVCYSAREKEYGSAVAGFLKNMDFCVYDRCEEDEPKDFNYYFSQEYQKKTEQAIREAAQHGCFLFLMTRKSMQAKLMLSELRYAMNIGASIAVAFIRVSPWDLPDELMLLLADASTEEIDEDEQTGLIQIASLVGRTLLNKDTGKSDS